jgi:hypothetical protein
MKVLTGLKKLLIAQHRAMVFAIAAAVPGSRS